MTRTIILSAGGTGGHLFPAQALAEELSSRGWTIHLATDPRAEKFVDDFPATQVHIIKSATFSGKNPVSVARTASRLMKGYFDARRMIGDVKPDVMAGFGGYPTVPPLLAASHMGVPAVLHEQNAVMGRANRFLSPRVTAIGTGFELIGDVPANSAPVTTTGNPLRKKAHDAAEIPYDLPTANGAFNLLVFGGSQGAHFFAQIMPEALKLLEPQKRNRINLTLQARPEDLAATRDALESQGVNAVVDDFFVDLPLQIAQSHLAICRSGASSVSELALIGRPAVLVPLPGALDDDQGANAACLEKVGGGKLVRQKNLDAPALAEILSRALDNPQELVKQAENAKKAGVPDAANRLANLVEASL